MPTRWLRFSVGMNMEPNSSARYSHRIVVFASSIPGAGADFTSEFENAIQQYGLRGCFINFRHHGHYPDEDSARPFFELVVQLDVPVMNPRACLQLRRGVYEHVPAHLERGSADG